MKRSHQRVVKRHVQPLPLQLPPELWDTVLELVLGDPRSVLAFLLTCHDAAAWARPSLQRLMRWFKQIPYTGPVVSVREDMLFYIYCAIWGTQPRNCRLLHKWY